MVRWMPVVIVMSLLGTAVRAQVQIVPGTPVKRDNLPAPEPIKAARQALAEEQTGRVLDVLNPMIEGQQASDNSDAFVPEAYYLRGCAKLLRGDEYDALRDFEHVAANFPASDFFAPALERQLDVARLYLGGLKLPGWLFRIDSGVPLAEDLIVRIAERLPGSALAERAIMTLADYYAKQRDLVAAAEAYDTFVRLFPRSGQQARAQEQRIYARIAQFKGPGYDTSVLKDAKVLVEEFQEDFPARAQQAGLGDALVARLDESEAASMLTTARWYEKRGDLPSARLVLKRLVRNHPRSASAQTAVAMIDSLSERIEPGKARAADREFAK